MSDLESVERSVVEFEHALGSVTTTEDANELDRVYLGKNSAIRRALKNLGQLDPEQRKQAATQIGEQRSRIERLLEAKREALARGDAARTLEAEWIDRSMPGTWQAPGHLNPVALVEEQCLALMRQLGFELEDGPEIETEYYCFDALNIPKHHPARDMQDTFFVEGGLVLRTHTTSVQSRVLSKRLPPPLRIVSRGRVYRNEDVDATHLAMFHQLEGVWLQPGTTFAQLKWVLRFIAGNLFGSDVPVRFKPKYYPYTEPSLGMDVRCTVCLGAGCGACHGSGWVTVIGAGMIHPKVLRGFGYDPEQVSGFAFGWGTTRLAAQFFNVPEVRALYQQDVRFFRTLPARRP